MTTAHKVGLGAGAALVVYLLYRWKVSGAVVPTASGCSGAWFNCFTGTASTCSPGYTWVDAPELPNGGYCGKPCSSVPGCSVSVSDDSGMVLASTGTQDGPITSPSQLP